jgi:hypothetical protein
MDLSVKHWEYVVILRFGSKELLKKFLNDNPKLEDFYLYEEIGHGYADEVGRKLNGEITFYKNSGLNN